MTTGHVKGLTFADLRAFLHERFDDGAWARLREQLTEHERPTLDAAIALGWYDLDVYMHVLEALPAAARVSRTDVLREFARYAAERHVSRVHRVLFTFASPALVLERAGEIWSRFFDSGRWKVSREGDHRAVGELLDFVVPSPSHCEFLAHYLRALFERVGAKEVRCTHARCRSRGDSLCSFVVDWK